MKRVAARTASSSPPKACTCFCRLFRVTVELVARTLRHEEGGGPHGLELPAQGLHLLLQALPLRLRELLVPSLVQQRQHCRDAGALCLQVLQALQPGVIDLSRTRKRA